MQLNLSVISKGLIVLIIWLPVVCTAEQQTGPLRGTNQFPPHMMFLTPMPRAARAISRNTLSVALAFDYFSIYSNAVSSDYRILMDMEAIVSDLRLEYGFTDKISAGIRIPLVSMLDGFLDRPLEQFHRTFGMPNYGKEKSPHDKFAYSIEKQDRSWFHAQKGGLNLTDPTFSVQMELLQLDQSVPTTIALAYELKAPLGDKASGFGSGSWDHGVFVPMQFGFSNVNLYIMPGFIRVGTPDLNYIQLPVRDIKSFFIGGEYLFTSKTSILAQINSYTSPFVNTGIVKLDTPSVELSLGMRWTLAEQVSFEFSFSEDLTRSAPDFNLHALVSYRLRREATGPKKR